jgi:hypothetical protein
MPSAVIRSFNYDEESRALLIVFQSGRRYRYLDVPSETTKGLRGAFAKGEFFNNHIRGRFAFVVARGYGSSRRRRLSGSRVFSRAPD